MLSFHQPEDLAAVLDEKGSAYHINLNGQPAYKPRYLRTFGFYCGFAAVQDHNGTFYHIKPNGTKAYDQVFDWVGNFHKVLDRQSPMRCVVRHNKKNYFYIDSMGHIKTGPFSYAGDYSSDGYACVINLEGHSFIIDVGGNISYSPSSSNSVPYFDSSPPHKRIASVKDRKGWFYVDPLGKTIGCPDTRYLSAEPHYNGQALVRLKSGEKAIINEEGEIILKLPLSHEIIDDQLTSLSMSYWHSFALKMILESHLLEKLANTNVSNKSASEQKQQIADVDLKKQLNNATTDLKFQQILINVCDELGLIQNSISFTAKGYRILENDIIKDRLQYWLQNRYIKAWLPLKHTTISPSSSPSTTITSPSRTTSPSPSPTIRTSHSTTASNTLNTTLPNGTEIDIFKELSTNPTAVALSQRVLSQYATTDWKGITPYLKLQSHDKVIVDIAGGAKASLLTEIQKHIYNTTTDDMTYICMERPEVVKIATSCATSPNNKNTTTCNDRSSNFPNNNSINNSKSTIPTNTDNPTIKIPNLQFVSGDLFEGPIPLGNVYLMSRVLHDWNDNKVVQILKQIASECPTNARLIVIDREVTDKNKHAFLSLHMYLLQRAYERTYSEWICLFTKSGWSIDYTSNFNEHTIFSLYKLNSNSVNTTNNEITSTSKKDKGSIKKAVVPIAGTIIILILIIVML